MLKLTVNNNQVNCLFKSDKDFVKHTVSEKEAMDIISNGNLVESDRSDYKICVDGLWYFEGEPKKERKLNGKKNS